MPASTMLNATTATVAPATPWLTVVQSADPSSVAQASSINRTMKIPSRIPRIWVGVTLSVAPKLL